MFHSTYMKVLENNQYELENNNSAGNTRNIFKKSLSGPLPVFQTRRKIIEPQIRHESEGSVHKSSRNILGITSKNLNNIMAACSN